MDTQEGMPSRADSAACCSQCRCGYSAGMGGVGNVVIVDGPVLYCE